MKIDARTRDTTVLSHGTSADAAAMQNEQHSDRVKAVIMTLLNEHGPMTDDEITERYLERAGSHPLVPLVTPQSIRTRRAALVVAGHIRASEAIGYSKLGHRATVWCIA